MTANMIPQLLNIIRQTADDLQISQKILIILIQTIFFFNLYFSADGMTYSFGIFYNEFLIYFNEGKGYTACIASILVGVTLCSGNLFLVLDRQK